MFGSWYQQGSFLSDEEVPPLLVYIPLYGRLRSHEERFFRLQCDWLQREAFNLQTKAQSHRQPEDLNASLRWAARYMEWHMGWEKTVMAGKKTYKADDARAEWKGFVELRLSDAQLTELDGWKCPPAAVFELLSRLIVSGYRWTGSYNADRKLACVVVTANASELSWSGWGMSSFDADIYQAAKMACFKHFYLLAEDWTPLLGRSGAIRGRG